jgi:hypothetical protein
VLEEKAGRNAVGADHLRPLIEPSRAGDTGPAQRLGAGERGVTVVHAEEDGTAGQHLVEHRVV